MVLLSVLSLVPPSLAEDIKDTIAYKLSILHTKDQDPEAAMMNQAIEPSRATLTEFHWIVEALKNRCKNSETEIADSIVQTWQYVKSKGYAISLLDIARDLSASARNKLLFGDQKVDFRRTTSYWIAQFQAQTKNPKK